MRRKRMFAAAFVATVGAGILCPWRMAAQEAQPGSEESQIYPLFFQTLEHAQHERYDAAIATARRIRTLAPEEPVGAFGLLVPYQTINRNYRVRTYDATVDSLLDLAIDLAERAIKRGEKQAVHYFYLGSAYGLRSLNHVINKNWVHAFRDGVRVRSNFERALKRDPNFVDAYFGLGMYNYWLGAKSKILRGIPFARNRRQTGLKQLRLVCDKGTFLKVDAMYGLSLAYYNEGKFQEALTVTDWLKERFPQNPTLLYRRGRIFQELGRWREAKGEFEALYQVLLTTRYRSVSYQIDCLYQMARSEYETERLAQALELCGQAVALEKECDFAQERDGPFEKFADIQKALHKLHKKLKSLDLVEATTAGSH